MKNSLWKMLTAAFSLVLLFAFLITWISVAHRMRSEFSDLVNRGDVEAARALALTLSSRGPEEWRGSPPPAAGMRPMMPGGHMVQPRQRIVVTNSRGDIVFHSFPRLPEEVKELVKTRPGEEILINGRSAGSVYIGSMLGDGLLPYQERFLKAVGRSLLISALLSAAAAIAAVLFLTYRIVQPIGELSRAAQRIGEGDLSIRIPFSKGTAAEFRRLNMRFNQMAANLLRSEERQKQLVADVSHELRTPVSLLKSRLELLQEGLYAPDRRQFGQLIADVDRLSSLIEELRAVSGVERGQDRLELAEIDAGGICESAAERFRPSAREKGVEIVCSTGLKKGEGRLRADEGKIERVLDNLILNALRYAPALSTVTLSVERSGGGFRFTVQDEGPGVDPDSAEKLFERFYRGKEGPPSASGRGLGLSIARSIVELHGGRINFLPSEKGARITFFLPA